MRRAGQRLTLNAVPIRNHFPMAWSLNEVAALLKTQGSAGSDQDEQSWRTTQLKEVLAAVRQESADGLAAVVEKLGDGARDREF